MPIPTLLLKEFYAPVQFSINEDVTVPTDSNNTNNNEI